MEIRQLDAWAECVRHPSAAVQWERISYIPTRQKRPTVAWAGLPPGTKIPPGDDADGMAIILRGSGLVVLDVDVKGGAPGEASLDVLQGAEEWPETLTVRTPSGGRHYYWTVPVGPGRPMKDRIGFLPGLDWKAAGIVLLPGSGGAEGSAGYTIETAVPPAPCPSWILDRVKGAAPGPLRAPAPPLDGHPRAYTSADLAALAKGRHGDAWGFLRDAAAGQCPARVRGASVGPDRGPIDPLLWQAFKALASEWLDMDPAQVVRGPLGPALSILQAQDQLHGNPIYSEEDWVDKLRRALEEAREEAAASVPLLEALEESGARAVAAALASGEAVAVPKEVAVAAGQITRPPWDLYVHLANGTTYIVPRDMVPLPPPDGVPPPPTPGVPPPAPPRDVYIASRSALGVTLRDLGFVVSYATKSGGQAILTPAELHHHYDAKPFRAAVRDLTLRRVTVDPETLILRIPTAIRPEIPPRHHPAIDRWLRLMIPDDADRARVYEWIGTFGSLEMSQPALWLTGPAKSGKTLLARALAGLWGKPRPTTGEDAIGRFNADLADCPLVHFDEDFPRDWRGNPRVQDFKNLTDDYAHPLEQKFLPQETLNGAARVVLTSNHFALVTRATDLQSDDVQALQRRIIHVHVSEESRAYLEGQPVPEWTAPGGALVQHLRSIEETYRTTRKLGGHCPLIERKLRTDTTEAYPILLAVSEWLRRGKPTGGYAGASVIDGVVAVQPNAIARILSSSDLVLRPPSRQRIRAALESLGERKSVRIPDVGPRWVYLLDMERYLSWADAEDNGREEILELIAAHGAPAAAPQ